MYTTHQDGGVAGRAMRKPTTDRTVTGLLPSFLGAAEAVRMAASDRSDEVTEGRLLGKVDK
jgi:hypothetical protein